MCKTLLCFSQNFLNQEFEKDKNARVNIYLNPQGGYPIVVTHVTPETELDKLRAEFPKISVFAVVEDGVSPKYKGPADASIYYRPVADWQKKLGITADDIMTADRKRQNECKRSATVEALGLAERRRMPPQPRFAV